MPRKVETPHVSPGGLVTVAFLKAQLDEGNDHLGIFMPLVLDVVARITQQSFSTTDVQEALSATHGVAMPQQTVGTLLRRATSKKYLSRDSGRYRRNTTRRLPISKVAAEKEQIHQGQVRLAEALQRHADRRGLKIESSEIALDSLLRFLEAEQVALLLGTPPGATDFADESLRERAVVAEFIQDVVGNDQALLGVLRGMLEGLVLYHAAFLPDINNAKRNFKELRVVFDSGLVRQALGYEGTALQTLMRETIDVLKASGVSCLIFDKTLHEIQRILAKYEELLGTAAGRNSLRPVPMARHFLTQRYSPSDVREMSVLLELDIARAGFHIQKAASRKREYTAGERALAERLSDPATRDQLEPRVVHDVDCVAGVLTLRRGHRSTNIEEARAIFATDSPLVIRNCRLWWSDDEHEGGTEPVVHIRALANLAWLKRPSLSINFKIHELVALCRAALRPDQRTWERFLRHLKSLKDSQRLTSDEITGILVSGLSDELLRNAEYDDDAGDVDAVTFDDIVARVTASYGAEASDKIQAVTVKYEAKLAEVEAREREASGRADAALREASEQNRNLALRVDGRARTWASRLTRAAQWSVVALIAAGALVVVLGHPFHPGWVGVTTTLALAVFVALEVAGILTHVSHIGASMESVLTRRLRNWLAGQGEMGSGPSEW